MVVLLPNLGQRCKSHDIYCDHLVKKCFTLNFEKIAYRYHGNLDKEYNERKSEQAHIPHAPTLLENAVYNEWQFQALVTDNRTKKGI